MFTNAAAFAIVFGSMCLIDLSEQASPSHAAFVPIGVTTFRTSSPAPGCRYGPFLRGEETAMAERRSDGRSKAGVELTDEVLDRMAERREKA